MGSIWLSECHRAFVPIPLSQELLSENMVVYPVYGDNYLKLGNRRLSSLFTVLFAAPEGKMKQILYSSCLDGLALILRKKKNITTWTEAPFGSFCRFLLISTEIWNVESSSLIVNQSNQLIFQFFKWKTSKRHYCYISFSTLGRKRGMARSWFLLERNIFALY